jgi:hypothetical protein
VDTDSHGDAHKTNCVVRSGDRFSKLMLHSHRPFFHTLALMELANKVLSFLPHSRRTLDDSLTGVGLSRGYSTLRVRGAGNYVNQRR